MIISPMNYLTIKQGGYLVFESRITGIKTASSCDSSIHFFAVSFTDKVIIIRSDEDMTQVADIPFITPIVNIIGNNYNKPNPDPRRWRAHGTLLTNVWFENQIRIVSIVTSYFGSTQKWNHYFTCFRENLFHHSTWNSDVWFHFFIQQNLSLSIFPDHISHIERIHFTTLRIETMWNRNNRSVFNLHW